MFCFKQKTAYEMLISDWSSDVCSSDLIRALFPHDRGDDRLGGVVDLLEDMSLAGLKRPLTAGNLGLGALLAAFDVLRLGFRRLLGQRLVLKAGTKRFLFLLEALCPRLRPATRRLGKECVSPFRPR